MRVAVAPVARLFLLGQVSLHLTLQAGLHDPLDHLGEDPTSTDQRLTIIQTLNSLFFKGRQFNIVLALLGLPLPFCFHVHVWLVEGTNPLDN